MADGASSATQRVDRLSCSAPGRPASRPAWRLAELGYPVTVLERDDAVGGMGRTHQAAATTPSTSGRTPFTSARPSESREILEAIKPFFGDDPLILTRGTRVLLRGKEYVYPLETAAGADRRQPVAVGADRLRLPRRDGEVDVRAAAEGRLVRRVGRPQPRAARCTTCASASTRSACGDCRPAQISSKQAQRVAKLNLKNIILRTLGIKADPATYFTEVHVSARGHQPAVREHGGRGARPPATACKLECAGRPARARRRPHRARRLPARTAASTTLDCDIVLSTLPLPALVEHDVAGAAGAVVRARRQAALPQPEADLHRAQARADDRLPLGLPARRAVPRQPRCRSRRTSARTWCRPTAPCSASSCRCGRTSRCGRRATRRSTGSRCAT